MEIYFGAPDYILERIIILQKKIFRSINSLPYNSHTDQYFKSMSVLKANDIHFFSMSTRAFQSREKLASITHSELHPYNTRNKDNPILPFFHLTKSQKAPSYRMIRTWNSLPNHIRACKTMKTFKSKLKEKLISQY